MKWHIYIMTVLRTVDQTEITEIVR